MKNYQDVNGGNTRVFCLLRPLHGNPRSEILLRLQWRHNLETKSSDDFRAGRYESYHLLLLQQAVSILLQGFDLLLLQQRRQKDDKPRSASVRSISSMRSSQNTFALNEFCVDKPKLQGRYTLHHV